MKFKFHVIAQIALWILLWFMMSLNKQNAAWFYANNLGVYFFQVLGILFASYVFLPRYLFVKKQYFFFIVISLFLILGFAFLSSTVLRWPVPLRWNMPMGGGAPPGPKPPPPFFIHFLLIAVAYILNILVETFIFAQKKEQAIAIQRAALVESELKFLKMQINPHFLFNALNNIYALSVTNSEKTQESISTLSDMLRYVIYDCETQEVPIEKEITYIGNYISLFKLRSSKPFNITFTHQLESPMRVAPMVLIPFIENALKHSGLEKSAHAFVTISIQTQKGELWLVIENSRAQEVTQSLPYSGVGLENVKKRLDIMYAHRHELTIEKSATFTVKLKLTPHA